MTETNSSNESVVLNAIASQQRRLRWLTALGVMFWVAAVVGCVGVLISYAVFYQPKERQILSDYVQYGHLPKHGTNSSARLTPDEAMALQFSMTYVVTKGILAVAVAVTVLSCGTLTTLLLVVLNRRVTFKQINASMAQISDQLRQLQAKSSV